MLNLYAKIFSTPKKIIKTKDLQEKDVLVIGKELNKKIKKLFRGSLAIRELDAGSDNAVEQELVALSNAYYDAERFGIHFVASPRHADMLIVTGVVSRNMQQAVLRTYEATPNPKIIVAVGDEAIDGGIFRDSYAVVGEVNKVIPVDYGIPGNPPSPLVILQALLRILNDLDKKK
ncbi:MAG: formate hydrogenlyase [Patescibacteria group bacterium]